MLTPGLSANLTLPDYGRLARHPITIRNGVRGGPGHFPKALLTTTTLRVFASKPHCGPLLDLDPGHENRLTLAVRTEYQGLAILQAGRQLRKCTGDVRQVNHDDRVRTRWKVCYLLLQPRGLSSRPTLHALTVITKFGPNTLRANNALLWEVHFCQEFREAWIGVNGVESGVLSEPIQAASVSIGLVQPLKGPILVPELRINAGDFIGNKRKDYRRCAMLAQRPDVPKSLLVVAERGSHQRVCRRVRTRWPGSSEAAGYYSLSSPFLPH
jgi:hypothetical protein